jgi:hypothetical protein
MGARTLLSFAAVAAISLGALVLGAEGCGSSSGSGAGPSSGGHASTSGGGGPGGGGAGGAPECRKASQCPAPHSECVEAACVAGACTTAPLKAGTALGDPTPGDCKKLECDGQGHAVDAADDNDVPPGTDCADKSCSAGNVVTTDANAGTICTGGVCDGMGSCVGCNTTADCEQPAGECSFVTCDANVCTTHDKDLGTPLSTQTTGDCKLAVCDGSGGTTTQNDDMDVPDDGNDCTLDGCNAGAPVHTPQQGQPCGTGLVCDAMGVCDGCTDASQCPPGDVCKTPVCNTGSCSFNFVAAGTLAGTQTPNDCQKSICDGMGTLQTVPDPNDPPLDDGDPCTGESCSGGMPVHPPLGQGTTCMTSTATGVCDGNGTCVACNNASDCPQPQTICQSATCTGNVCGLAPANNGGVCNAATCMNGIANAADLCANGACVDGGTTMCSPYVCGATACETTCAGDNDCVNPPNTCDTGIGRCTNGPKCTDYCNEMAINCTGANLMYFSNAACLATCAQLPQGALTDMGGQDTLGCRLYHGGAPAAGDPMTHCPHAGPAGEAVCGPDCTSFCTLAAGLCTGANKQWPDMASCLTDCATFPTAPQYNASITSGNSFACRMYHLTAASLAPSTHCPHIQKVSAVCF